MLVRNIGKATLEFDKGMRNVNSLARLSEKQFASLEKQVLSLGKTTGQSPKTLSEGLYDIVSSGFKAAQGLKILETSAIAATAGLTDTATSTKAIVAILNAYQLGADRASNVSSMLFKEVQLGVNTFEELATNIGDTAPMASALKIPFSDVAAALALITLHGTNMAEASTQVSRVMADLLKPSEGLTKQLAAMGFESGEAAIEQLGFVGVIKKLSDASKGSASATSDWFQNIRSLRGMLNLTGPNLKKFNEFAEQIGASYRKGGEDVKAFNEQSKSISVQWAKAKAAFTAAAIPVATLLFPALSSAAGGVANLATKIEQNMPMIRSQFGGIVTGATEVTSALARIGFSAEGMSVIVGTTAAVATAKLAFGIKALAAGFGILGGPLGMTVASIGILSGTLFYAYLKSQGLGAGLKDLQNALRGVTDAAQSTKDAMRGLSSAKLATKSAALAVEQAEISYASAVKQSGKGSLEARTALNALKQARLSHQQAIDNETTAEEKATASKRADHRASQSLTKAYGLLNNANAQALNAMQTADGGAARFAKSMRTLADSFDPSEKKARDFANAAAELVEILGRIPTRKEVEIHMKYTYSGSGLYSRTGKDVNRAKGGTIPGATGQTVPVLAHAGEVILNSRQVNVLGGARRLANLFGWSGDQAAFAGGGVVGGLRSSAKSPHNKRRNRAIKAKTKTAKAALAAWAAIDQKEADADRDYGQLVREYDISTENFITTDEDGNESLNTTDITTRLGEIDNLITARNEMLTLLDSEKTALQDALDALAKAIAKLKKAIREERKAAKHDREEASKITKKITAERKKPKPNQKTIDSLTKQAGNLTTQAGKHDDAARGFQEQIDSFVGSQADVRANLNHVLPYDRRDVALDVSTLNAEKDQINALSPSTSSGTSSTATSADTSELLRQIALLRQALTIRGAQTAIIGSFQRGALHVPETGPYLLHAGEGVTPAGRGSVVTEAAPSVVYITLSGGISEQDIDAKIEGATDRVVVKIGSEADRLRREGR